MAAADDVRLILADSDDVFTAVATSSPCILSTFDDVVATDNFGGGKQYVRRTNALVCADDFPNLSDDDQVSVNQVNYKVLDTRLIQDGHMLEVCLQKA